MKPFLCDGLLVNKTLQPKILISDCISCTVTEELNGKYEAVFTLPINSVYAKMINNYSYVYIKPNPIRDCQLFQIYKTADNNSGLLTVYCEHIRYNLNHYPCPMVYGSTLSFLLNSINSAMTYTAIPFSLFTDISSEQATQISCVKSIGAVIAGSEESLIDTYGGEWEFDNYTCMLWANRGSDKNIVLQYNYDIKKCQRETERSNTYTHIFPYYEWALKDGSIATITLTHKSLESKYPTISARDLIQIDKNFVEGETPAKIYLVNLAEYFDLDLTAGYEKLNISPMAENWLEQHKAELLGIDISATLDFAYIKSNIALNQCMLGDTVRVRIPNMSIETTTKIVKSEYDSIKECYKSLDIGTLKSKIDTLISQNTTNIAIIDKKIARAVTKLAN